MSFKREEKYEDTLRWDIRIKVDKSTVATGFNPTESDFAQTLSRLLPQGIFAGLSVEILRSPPEAIIKALQKG